MENTSRDAGGEKRVGLDTCSIDGTTQTGPPATGSRDTSGIEIGAIEATGVPEEEGDFIYVATEEDGIFPDDAPEVAMEGMDDEVCVLSSNGTAVGLISAYRN